MKENKELYKASIKLIEESNKGVKVLQEFFRYSRANSVIEAQKNINWHLNNDDKIYLGIDKNKSTTEKIYRWEMVDISIVRDVEEMKNNYVDIVRNKLIDFEEKNYMSDGVLADTIKEYGIDCVARTTIYLLRTGKKGVRYSSIKKIDNALDQLETLLNTNMFISKNVKEEIEEKKETLVTIEIDITQSNADAMYTYLGAVNLEVDDYINELLNRDLKEKKKAIIEFKEVMKKLRGDV